MGALDLTYPEGSALAFNEPFAWPLDRQGEMRDGWFEGLPYPLLVILGERAYQRHLDARRDWESRVLLP